MKPEYIVIHHSATKDGVTMSWQAIRDYHVKEMGWNDIGYHFGIELINNRYEILMGRMPNETGAHCKEDRMNQRSLGICCAGNFDEIKPPDAQWQMCLSLVRYWMGIHSIKTGNIIGHRERATYKSCPGKMFDMDEFRSFF
jgi:N-acetylmuramoyl-L-alanine amidase